MDGRRISRPGVGVREFQCQVALLYCNTKDKGKDTVGQEPHFLTKILSIPDRPGPEEERSPSFHQLGPLTTPIISGNE